jgi:hypothetical protein
MIQNHVHVPSIRTVLYFHLVLGLASDWFPRRLHQNALCISFVSHVNYMFRPSNPNKVTILTTLGRFRPSTPNKVTILTTLGSCADQCGLLPNILNSSFPLSVVLCIFSVHCLCCPLLFQFEISGSHGGRVWSCQSSGILLPCSLVEVDRRFRGPYCLHDQNNE